jgi:hypothetical protein
MKTKKHFINTFLTEQTFMVLGLVWRMKEAVDNAQTSLTQTTSATAVTLCL